MFSEYILTYKFRCSHYWSMLLFFSWNSLFQVLYSASINSAWKGLILKSLEKVIRFWLTSAVWIFKKAINFVEFFGSQLVFPVVYNSSTLVGSRNLEPILETSFDQSIALFTPLPKSLHSQTMTPFTPSVIHLLTPTLFLFSLHCYAHCRMPYATLFHARSWLVAFPYPITNTQYPSTTDIPHHQSLHSKVGLGITKESLRVDSLVSQKCKVPPPPDPGVTFSLARYSITPHVQM